MTAEPIAAGERLASEVMHRRLADNTFDTHVRKRCRKWDVDRDTFLAQVESVVLVALLATGDDAQGSAPDDWCAAGAAALRQQQEVELFADLPALLPESIRLRVEQLRLMSTGLTPQSAHRWLRLSDTASEFLDPEEFLEPVPHDS
ncbi:hypothetical protein ACH4UM_37360 [Streptomyces sp. NPDC020801]|uniref:hypothetical protein n=1 Tax=unclassified Streptomyces TaxID=2593676 RepID=UPI0037B13CD8